MWGLRCRCVSFIGCRFWLLLCRGYVACLCGGLVFAGVVCICRGVGVGWVFFVCWVCGC